MAWFFSLTTNDKLQWHEDQIFERIKTAWHIYNKLASQTPAKPAMEFLRQRWSINTQKLPKPCHIMPPHSPCATLSFLPSASHFPPLIMSVPHPRLGLGRTPQTMLLLIHFPHCFFFFFLLDQASFGNGSWNLNNDAIV